MNRSGIRTVHPILVVVFLAVAPPALAQDLDGGVGAETGANPPVSFGTPSGSGGAESSAVSKPSQNDLSGVSLVGAMPSGANYRIMVDGFPVDANAFGANASGIFPDFTETAKDTRNSFGFMPDTPGPFGGIHRLVINSGTNDVEASLFTYLTLSGPSSPTVSRNGEAIGLVSNNGGVLGGPLGNLQVGGDVGGPIVPDRLWFYIAFMPSFGSIQNTRFTQVVVDDGNGNPKLDASGNTILAPCYASAPAYSNSGYAGPKWSDPNNPCHQNDTAQDSFFTHQSYFTLAKLTYAIASGQTLSVEGLARPYENRYDSASYDANMTPLPFLYSETGASYLGAIEYQGTFLDEHLTLNATLGYTYERSNLSSPNGALSGSSVLWRLPHSVTEFEDDPTTLKVCQGPSGAHYLACPVSDYATGGLAFADDQQLGRIYGQLAATGVFDLVGKHRLKVGFDYEQTSFQESKSYPGGAALEENASLAPLGVPVSYLAYGQYGYQSVPNDPNSAVTLAKFAASSQSVTDGFFLQDSVAFRRIVSLSAGLRWDLQNMFAPGSASGISLKDNIAPRFQITVDPTRSGRAKIYAHWGRYYDSLPLGLTDYLSPSEQQALDYRTQCVTASPTVGGSPAGCPIVGNGATSLGGSGNYRYVGAANTPISPDLQGQYNDVWGAGVIYEVLPDLSAEVSYLDSTSGGIIQVISPDDGNSYYIANPARPGPFQLPTSTVTSPGQTAPAQLPTPLPVRRYQALTFDLKKKLSRGWKLGFRYTFSHSWGNYEGASNSSTNQGDPYLIEHTWGAGTYSGPFNTIGPANPYGGSQYDLVMLEANRYGPLSTDRPHRIRLTGSYTYEVTNKVSLNASTEYIWESGTPVNVLGADPVYGPGESFVLPSGSGGRLPPFWSWDLSGEVRWKVGKQTTIILEVKCFNVTNREVKTAVDETYTFDPVYPVANGSMADLRSLKNVNGAPVAENTNFLNATAYQTPRTFRLNLAVQF
jgi:hypothetical protein